MRTILYSFLLGFLLAVGIGCDRERDNGKLDGFWQLTHLRTTTEQSLTVEEVKSEKIFLAVQKELFEIRYKGVYSSTFVQADGHLRLNGLHESNFGSDVPVTEAQIATLGRLGIDSATPDFEILVLNDEQLILKTRDTELQFRRY